MTDRRVTNTGKQVLLDGVHFADARDDTAARGIADALEYFGAHYATIPSEAYGNIEEALK